jgi:tRNA (guanine37-N1)-methyltransferase
MVLMPGPVFDAVERVESFAVAPRERTRRMVLTPQGERLEQTHLRQLASAEWIVLLCGHYEGFDERIRRGLDFEEFSIGDYVLTGGEIPAMVIIDGVTRLLPGVLGNEASLKDESFAEGLLEFPQYTRPPEFRGMRVPEILLSGDHQKIAAWRRQEARRRTMEMRPDLIPDDQQEGAVEP